MLRIKLFLEFVSGNQKSIFINLTYNDISKLLNCTIDEIQDFEEFLDENKEKWVLKERFRNNNGFTIIERIK
jgi:hypothetical protein